MNKFIKCIIGLIGVVCIYAIIQINLGYFWSIGAFENAEQLNSIIINLSYSYIAGLIVYIFTVEIPTIIHNKKIKPIINQNIENIGVSFHNLLVGFTKEDESLNIDVSDISNCKKILTNVDWNTKNELPIYPSEGNKLYQTFYYDYKNIQNEITRILQIYKSDLTTEQLLLLEDLTDMKHVQVLGVIIAAKYKMNNEAGNAIANEFAEKLETYAKLKSTI